MFFMHLISNTSCTRMSAMSDVSDVNVPPPPKRKRVSAKTQKKKQKDEPVNTEHARTHKKSRKSNGRKDTPALKAFREFLKEWNGRHKEKMPLSGVTERAKLAGISWRHQHRKKRKTDPSVPQYP